MLPILLENEFLFLQACLYTTDCESFYLLTLAIMAESEEPHERSRLLSTASIVARRAVHDVERQPSISSIISKDEEALGNTAVGEILPYNDYSSIDFLHDLVHCSPRRYFLTVDRSKTRIDVGLSMLTLASEADYLLVLMHCLVGFVLQSLESSPASLPFSSTSQRHPCRILSLATAQTAYFTGENSVVEKQRKTSCHAPLSSHGVTLIRLNSSLIWQLPFSLE
jgi:hypothetical protein